MGDLLNIYPARLKVETEIFRLLSVPSQRTLFAEDIISFEGFEQRLIDALAPSDPLDDTARWLLLREAVTGDPVIRRHGHLGALISAEGFIRSVGDLIRQLKLGLVTVDDLENISGYAPGKEEWIKSVFARYGRLLNKHGRPDREDAIRAMLEKLESGAPLPAHIERKTQIHIHELFHFSPARFELLRLVGSRVPLVIHFPLPDGRRKIYDFVERDIQKFQGLEDEAGLIELSFEQPGESGPLVRFADTLFDEGPPAAIEGLETHVEIIRHAGRYREIEEAAAAILAVKGNRPWSDFCLVFRDMEPYGAIVDDVFRRARVPVHLKRGVPLKTNPFVRAIMSVFTAIERDFDRDEVMKLAGSPYFSFLPGGLPGYEADRLAAQCNIAGGPPREWERRFALLKNPKEITVAKKIVSLVKALEGLAKARRAGTCRVAFNKILALLKESPSRFSDPAALRDAFARGAFRKALESFELSVKGLGFEKSEFSWRDLRHTLEAAMGDAANPETISRNRVYALTVADLAGMRFPYLFVCGLHDGEFPLRPRKGGILAEAEKREFNIRHAETALREFPKRWRGRTVFSRVGESWDEEAFLFHLAVRSATFRIYFNFSEYDLGGKELLPSPFIDELQAAFPQIVTRQSPPVALEKEYHRQLDDPAREAKLLQALFASPPEAAGSLQPLYRRFARKPEFRLACEKSRIELARTAFYGMPDPVLRAAAATRYCGKLEPGFPPLHRHFARGTRPVFSPTALERYARCPFRYFMADLLACEPVKSPAPDIEPTVEGRVAHRALELYYVKKPRNLSAPPGLDAATHRRRRMKECAAAAFVETEAAGEQGDPAVWDIARQRMLAALSLFVENEGDLFAQEPFTVVATEFSYGGKDAPLAISADGETVSLKGYADRIDWLPAGGKLRVIDYKYSSNPSNYRRLLKPELFCVESFQAPLYLYAALKLIGPRLPLHPSGGYASYFCLKRQPEITKPVPSAFDGAADSAELEAIASTPEFGGRLVAIVRRMEGGDFSVTPLDCVFCAFRRACRYQEVRQMDKNE